MSTNKVLFPYPLTDVNWIKSAVRGYVNGAMSGVIIRLPYLLNAAVMVALYADKSSWNNLRVSIKNVFYHARNLGFFALIYKPLCTVFRHFGVDNGLESLISGFIAGYFTAGRFHGLEGNVNYQIVLYTLGRSIEALLVGMQQTTGLPEYCNPRTPSGFRLFASVCMAMILFLSEHRQPWLKRNFVGTMDFIYSKSNSGSILPSWNHQPLVILVFLSTILGFFVPAIKLPELLTAVDRIGPSA